MTYIRIDKFMQIKACDELSTEEIKNGELESEKTRALVRQHSLQMNFGINPIQQDDPCLLLVTDSKYIKPTKPQVKSVVDLLISRGMTKADISICLDINPSGARALNYWLNTNSDRVIPYCAWRMLLSLAGLSITTMITHEDVKSRLMEQTIREFNQNT